MLAQVTSLKLENLSFKYSEDSPPVLHQCSIDLPSPGIYVFTGSTGCGKSTLLQLLAGLLQDFQGVEFSGRICLDGESFDLRQSEAFQDQIGLLLQDPIRQLHQDTVLHELMSGPIYQGHPWEKCLEIANEVAGQLGLYPLIDMSPEKLSVGQQQKVALAALMAIPRRILLLDEPSTYLDQAAKVQLRSLLERLAAEGHIVVVATHHFDWLGSTPKSIALMSGGRFDTIGPPHTVAYSDRLDSCIAAPLTVQAMRGLRDNLPNRTRPVDWEEVARFVEPLLGADCDCSSKLLPSPGPPLLETQSLSAGWKKGDFAMSNVSLSCFPGQALAVIGPNGSGKSTFLHTLAGTVTYASGDVSYDGKSYGIRTFHKNARHIGLVVQNPSEMLFEESCLREIEFGPKMLRLPGVKETAIQVLHEVGLQDYADTHPRSLSYGQQRLLSIASVLATKPKLLLLDEPEFGLDAKTWRHIAFVLKDRMERGTAVILVTHNLEVALHLSSQIVCLSEGHVRWSGPRKSLNCYSESIPLKLFGLSSKALMVMARSLSAFSASASADDFRTKIRECLCIKQE